MPRLNSVLAGFHELTGCASAVLASGKDGEIRIHATASPTATDTSWIPTLGSGPPRIVDSPAGSVIIAVIPGPQRYWLSVGPCRHTATRLDRFLHFLLPVVSELLQSSLEAEQAANELAERYEEINLLYSISEILGRSVAEEDTASIILREVSDTVGARRGSILVYNAGDNSLGPIASLGIDIEELQPIHVDDEHSLSAAAFRDQRVILAEEGEGSCPEESPYRRGSMLTLPITWTPPEGGTAQPLGVLNLSDRASRRTFSAGDQKLLVAIATQIGTAIQNARLVRASLDQQRLLHEMGLAHDLQMTLLPRTSAVAPEAEVAARVTPADSVGGDFYHLFRLTPERTGVMLGDVSGHGYRAALIMALAMSASAIHAQANADPGAMLAALLSTLSEELSSTEMFISTFYAVIDRAGCRLHYGNAGHPHAFVIGADGSTERLSATDPPLGMVDEPPHTRDRAWATGSDLLLLFTDGVTDAVNADGERYGEARVIELARGHRAESPTQIVDHIFAALDEHTGDEPLLDDAACIVVRS
ncbi:MAG: SpoIIE family protein phosphatase [Gemmatimonadota bacterium]|nr:SpoIIE family protein phosphatase [Gemmatimonadota bacterium]